MARIFGFDLGTTSIGFAVIDHDQANQTGKILRLGVRIFPEARDPDGIPLNQTRRQKRLIRRQLRRRRMRRRALNEALSAAGLLPKYGTPEWDAVMALDPYALRSRGIEERLEPHEFGRALYHLAQRRHFRGRDLEEETAEGETQEDKEAKSGRDATLQSLRARNITLGQWLAEKRAVASRGNPPQERRRGIHAHRSVVEEEFGRLWAAQAKHHAFLGDSALKDQVQGIVFAQRPVFWRTNTLGQCPFMPGEPLCPKGSWLAAQKRMLEKLNNLRVAGGNARPLDEEERAAILARLQTQASMSWQGVRAALKPLYKQRGEPGAEKSLVFNLELGGDRWLPGNAVEARLADIFGKSWNDHPHKQAIRHALHERLWDADYHRTPDGKRVVILDPDTRAARRAETVRTFKEDFGLTEEQCTALKELKFPTGWEPYSTKALQTFLPQLEAGTTFGALLNGPEWEEWRDRTFPQREKPTGEVCDRLPSPASREEQKRLAHLRNPTIVRTQNELRKVVNNLIRLYGRPDLIRVELTREVGRSKREREEMQKQIRKNERKRKEAVADLAAKGIVEPSRDTVEKWLLWKASLERCPYTGDQISFDDLFRAGLYDVEHIWPRSKSLDDSLGNKTLCRRDVNLEKGNRTPWQAFGHDADRWEAMKQRVWSMVRDGAFPVAKARKFCWEEDIPDDFAARQLTDTGYAARQAVAFLKRLWPDEGPTAPVRVQAVSGRVTGQLRRLWNLNNILSDDGEKTRDDHRHHAIDALVVACAHPGMTQRLSRYWQERDNPGAVRPVLPPPWSGIRDDAERAVGRIVVSHRVRKKVSGPLHKETVYGDTGADFQTGTGVYRQFVTRKPVTALTKSELFGNPHKDGEGIRDDRVRAILQAWVNERGGDPKKAFAEFPRLGENGAEIRKVRVLTKQQLSLMAPIATGYTDLGNNHHIAIYRRPDGAVFAEVVSLFEAARRLARRQPVVQRHRGDGSEFVMSLAPGEAVEIPEGEQRGIWIVKGIWSGDRSNGRVVLEATHDAVGTTTTRPTANSLIKRRIRKVSIDPVGRVRPARD